MSLIDKFYVNPETQLTTTLAVGGTGYAISPSVIIGALTILLLIGQLGLLALKYYSVYKTWKAKKNGLEE